VNAGPVCLEWIAKHLFYEKGGSVLVLSGATAVQLFFSFKSSFHHLLNAIVRLKLI
jgi:hypothetical protein